MTVISESNREFYVQCDLFLATITVLHYCLVLLGSLTHQRPLPVSTTRRSVRAGSASTRAVSVMVTRTAALVPTRRAAMVSELLERR